MVVDPEGTVLYEAGASDEVVTALVDFDAVALVRERGAFGLNRMLEQLDRHGSELDLPDVRRPLPAASGQPACLNQQLQRLVVRSGSATRPSRPTTRSAPTAR